jgi:hypothetical protein
MSFSSSSSKLLEENRHNRHNRHRARKHWPNSVTVAVTVARNRHSTSSSDRREGRWPVGMTRQRVSNHVSSALAAALTMAMPSRQMFS